MTLPSWANRTMWTGDNLDIMRGMNSESVDLIYLDPPFNSNLNYAAPIGSEAAGAAFKDTWELDDVDLAWHGEIAEQQPALYAIIEGTHRLPHAKAARPAGAHRQTGEAATDQTCTPRPAPTITPTPYPTYPRPPLPQDIYDGEIPELPED